MNHHILSNSGQSLPAKKLAFSTLRPESLTHPGCELPSPVRWRRVPPGHPTLPFRLHLSDSESWSPVGRRREPPGQTTLPFPPHGRRDLPIQTASIFLPSDVDESLPVTQLTFPSSPVRHSESWSPVGRRREHSWPDNLTFSNLLLDKAYPSDTAILKPPSDAGKSLLDRQTYLFHPAAGKAYPTTLPVDCKAFRPLNFTLLSKPVRLGSSGFSLLPTRRRGYPSGSVAFGLMSRRRRWSPGGLLCLPPASDAHPFDTVSLDLPSYVVRASLSDIPNSFYLPSR